MSCLALLMASVISSRAGGIQIIDSFFVILIYSKTTFD
jgi:hypothetical protein